jgi:hypothetical protein
VIFSISLAKQSLVSCDAFCQTTLFENGDKSFIGLSLFKTKMLYRSVLLALNQTHKRCIAFVNGTFFLLKAIPNGHLVDFWRGS